MSTPATRSIQTSARKWLQTGHWTKPFAATLTLKQRVTVTDGIHSITVPLTDERAGQNLRHFLNVLNKRVYGSAAQKYGKRLAVIPVLEGGRDKRLHYHLMIDCPRQELEESLPTLISMTWHQTQWGYDQTHVTPADSGWLTYMTKLRDKPDFASSIDWLNYHNP